MTLCRAGERLELPVLVERVSVLSLGDEKLESVQISGFPGGPGGALIAHLRDARPPRERGTNGSNPFRSSRESCKLQSSSSSSTTRLMVLRAVWDTFERKADIFGAVAEQDFEGDAVCSWEHWRYALCAKSVGAGLQRRELWRLGRSAPPSSTCRTGVSLYCYHSSSGRLRRQ